MNKDYIREDIDGLLSLLIAAHEKLVVAHVNASTCRTSFDYTKADMAEEAFEKTREEVLTRIMGIVATIG